MLQSNNTTSVETIDQSERQREKSKYELDEVQEHFAWSNEMLVDGIPFSKWLKIQELKKKREQNETK
jgi:hypothetical protein